MRFVTLLLTLFLLVPTAAFAQNASPPAVTPRATPNVAAAKPAPSTRLTPQELELVRGAVGNVGSSYQKSRTADGIGNIISGVLIGGLGMYLYLAEDNPEIRLIGVGIAFSGVAPIIAGMWNIFYKTSQEDMASKLLSDDTLLDGGGLLFVEQEARRARRARLVGGTTQIAAGAATLGSYYLLKEFFIAGPDNILLIFFVASSAIQVISGVVSLVGKSGPEKAYRDLLGAMGRDPNAKPSGSNEMSKLRWSPTLLSNDGKAALGLGLSFGF